MSSPHIRRAQARGAMVDHGTQHHRDARSQRRRGEQANPSIPADWQDKVLHARIEIGTTVLMGADIQQTEPMRSAYLTLTLDREEDAERRRAAFRIITMAHLDLVALIVEDYDPAIDFFVRVLRFELIEDVPSTTNDGRLKRWVVVRPAGGTTGILLARAEW